MNCTFFGHRNAPYSIRKKLKKAIESLADEGCENFFVGNSGGFDLLVQSVLEELKNENRIIKYRIVLSYIGERALSENQEKTIFPEGQERTLPKFAISKRNEWMIKNSDVAVVYLLDTATNTAKWIERARKKGLEIINLAKDS